MLLTTLFAHLNTAVPTTDNGPQLSTVLISLIPLAVGIGFGLTMVLIPRWFGFWMSNRAADLQRARDITAAAEAEARQHNTRIAELLMAAATNAPADKTLETVERLASQLAVSAYVGAGQDQTSTQVSNLIEDYHRQALTQANWQFALSALAAAIGLCVIVAVALLSTTSSTADVVVRSLPGLITEAIAALFFSQARDTRRRATDLFDRLRSDNMRRQALAVANAIDDPALRDKTRANIAMTMAQLLSFDEQRPAPTPSHRPSKPSTPSTNGQ